MKLKPHNSFRLRALCVSAAVFGALLTASPAMAVSGGDAVADQDVPGWLVTIAVAGQEPLAQRELCGGALVSPTRVVTAAHCLDYTDPNNLEVHVGATTLSHDGGSVVAMRGFTTNPKYKVVYSPKFPGNFSMAAAKNDIAVIELKKPVSGVDPLPVATTAPKVGTDVSIFGHGLTGTPSEQDPAIGDVVHRGNLKVIADSTCTSELGDVVDGRSVLCAESPTAAVCPGDSGSPLVAWTADGPVMVGVTSFGGEVVGKSCGEPAAAGFTDAAYLQSWATTPEPVLAPMPRHKLTMKGQKAAGHTLTCKNPGWSVKPDKLAYSWTSSHVENGFEFYINLKHQTRPKLKVTAAMAKHKLFCIVTASTPGGTVQLYADPV